MGTRSDTFYDVLGVRRDASPEDVERAYERVRKELTRDPELVDRRRAAIAKAAYTTLTDAAAREEYDALLRGGRPVVRLGHLLAVAGGVLLLVAIVWAWHAISSHFASRNEQLERLQSDGGRRIGRIEAALVSGEVRDLGIAVEIGEGQMAAICGDLPPGTALTVRQRNASSAAEATRNEGALCLLNVKTAHEGPALRASVPADGERVFVVLPSADRASVTEAVARPAPQAAPAAAFRLELRPAPPNGTPVYDGAGQLAGMVVAAGPNADALIIPASAIARLRSP
jgi:hypothetical protein